GVAIVTVLRLATLTEKRIGLVEKKQHAPLFRCVEDDLQVLFGFADVLAHHRREIDAIKIKTEFVREHLGREGLASARFAAEQRAHAESPFALLSKTPVLVHMHAVPNLRSHLPQDAGLQIGKDEIIPGSGWSDVLREVSQLRPRQRPACPPEIVAIDSF